jgi:hypothetical protein
VFHVQTNAFLSDPCPSVAGGDDVQQLCDAGEEEFLEIMALVGMASKPLHVRRLQKALQEWVSNPGESSETLRRKMECVSSIARLFDTCFHLEIRETAEHLAVILTFADIPTSYS